MHSVFRDLPSEDQSDEGIILLLSADGKLIDGDTVYSNPSKKKDKITEISVATIKSDNRETNHIEITVDQYKKVADDEAAELKKQFLQNKEKLNQIAQPAKLDNKITMAQPKVDETKTEELISVLSNKSPADQIPVVKQAIASTSNIKPGNLKIITKAQLEQLQERIKIQQAGGSGGSQPVIVMKQPFIVNKQTNQKIIIIDGQKRMAIPAGKLISSNQAITTTSNSSPTQQTTTMVQGPKIVLQTSQGQIIQGQPTQKRIIINPNQTSTTRQIYVRAAPGSSSDGTKKILVTSTQPRMILVRSSQGNETQKILTTNVLSSDRKVTVTTAQSTSNNQIVSSATNQEKPIEQNQVVQPSVSSKVQVLTNVSRLLNQQNTNSPKLNSATPPSTNNVLIQNINKRISLLTPVTKEEVLLESTPPKPEMKKLTELTILKSSDVKEISETTCEEENLVTKIVEEIVETNEDKKVVENLVTNEKDDDKKHSDEKQLVNVPKDDVEESNDLNEIGKDHESNEEEINKTSDFGNKIDDDTRVISKEKSVEKDLSDIDSPETNFEDKTQSSDYEDVEDEEDEEEDDDSSGSDFEKERKRGGGLQFKSKFMKNLTKKRKLTNQTNKKQQQKVATKKLNAQTKITTSTPKEIRIVPNNKVQTKIDEFEVTKSVQESPAVPEPSNESNEKHEQKKKKKLTKPPLDDGLALFSTPDVIKRVNSSEKFELLSPTEKSPKMKEVGAVVQQQKSQQNKIVKELSQKTGVVQQSTSQPPPLKTVPSPLTSPKPKQNILKSLDSKTPDQKDILKPDQTKIEQTGLKTGQHLTKIDPKSLKPEHGKLIENTTTSTSKPQSSSGGHVVENIYNNSLQLDDSSQLADLDLGAEEDPEKLISKLAKIPVMQKLIDTSLTEQVLSSNLSSTSLSQDYGVQQKNVNKSKTIYQSVIKKPTNVVQQQQQPQQPQQKDISKAKVSEIVPKLPQNMPKIPKKGGKDTKIKSNEKGIVIRENTTNKPLEVIRSDGRVVVIPPLEKPTTRASKRKQSTTNTQEVTKQLHNPFEEGKLVIDETPVKPTNRQMFKNNSDANESDSDQSWKSEDDPDRLWCICKQPHNNRFMICCDACEEWFHGQCVGVSKALGQQMEKLGKEWECPNCVKNKKIDLQKALDQAQAEMPLSTDSEDQMSETGVPREQQCIVCKGPSRSGSIYCSEKCIIQHSNNVERVIVFERKTGKCLSGQNAPTLTNLEQWLKEHPGFEVVTSENKALTQSKLPFADKRNLSLSSDLKSPKEVSTSGSGGGPNKVVLKQKTLSLQSFYGKHFNKQSPSVKAKVPAPGTPVANMLTKQGTLKIGNQQKPQQKILKTPPGQVEKLKRKPSISTQEVQAPGANEKPSGIAQEQLRENVRKTLAEHFMLRLKEQEEIKLTEDEIKELSNEIEIELYLLFNKDTGAKYRNKYRSLIFNIKDTKNQTLWRRICQRNTSPKELVRLSPEELASQELAQWRERENKHQLEMIKKNELDMLNSSITYVLKSHKGEEVIEKRSNIVDSSIIPDMEKDETTNENKSQSTFDSKKKDEDRHKNKSSSHHKKDNKHRSRDRKRSRSRDRYRSRSKDKKHRRSRSGSRHRHRSRDLDKDSKYDKNRHKSSKYHSSSKHKDSSSDNSFSKRYQDDFKDALTELDKKSKEILESLVDNKMVAPLEESKLWQQAENIQPDSSLLNVNTESESDHEPTSTVTIMTPPINNVVDDQPATIYRPTDKSTLPEYTPTQKSEMISSKAIKQTTSVDEPIIWRGIINMIDVPKFQVTAQEVSGDCIELVKDLPSTLEVVGRINPETVWDYLKKMRKSTAKQISIIRLNYDNEIESLPYQNFYVYLSSRKRFAVVKSSSTLIKDFYIMPQASYNQLPEAILPIKGPGFEESRPNLLLGILVSSKRKRMYSSDSNPSIKIITKKFKESKIPGRSYTPPPGNIVSSTVKTPNTPAIATKKAITSNQPRSDPRTDPLNKLRADPRVDPRLKRSTQQVEETSPIDDSKTSSSQSPNDDNIDQAKEDEIIKMKSLPLPLNEPLRPPGTSPPPDDMDAPYSPGDSDTDLPTIPINIIHSKKKDISRKIECPVPPIVAPPVPPPPALPPPPPEDLSEILEPFKTSNYSTIPGLDHVEQPAETISSFISDNNKKVIDLTEDLLTKTADETHIVNDDDFSTIDDTIISKQMEEINKQIEEKKKAIFNISEAAEKVGTKKETLNSLSGIAIPSNLQQILDSIKTKQPSDEDKAESDEEYTPEVIKTVTTKKDSPLTTVAYKPSEIGVISETIPLILPKIGKQKHHHLQEDLTIPLNLPISTKRHLSGSKRKFSDESSSSDTNSPKVLKCGDDSEKKFTGGGVLSQLSKDDLIRKANEMLLGEKIVENDEPYDPEENLFAESKDHQVTAVAPVQQRKPISITLKSNKSVYNPTKISSLQPPVPGLDDYLTDDE